MLKLGRTSPNLVNFCLHKSTTANFYPIMESDKDLLRKLPEYMVGGPSIVTTRKAVVDKTFLFAIQQTDANPLSDLMLVCFTLALCVRLCQLVCIRDGNSVRNLANINRVKTRRGILKTWSCHTFSEADHRVKWKVSTRRVHRKKIDAYIVDGLFRHCNTVFEAMGEYHYCSCQEARPSLTEEEFQRGMRKRKLGEVRKQYT